MKVILSDFYTSPKRSIKIVPKSDDSYYIGFTNNIARRFEEHSSGYNHASYTASRLPVQLVYHETFSNPTIGIAREKQLKKWSRAKKEALIAGHEKVLKALRMAVAM